MRNAFALVLALLAGAMLAACGGSGAAKTTATAPSAPAGLTKAEFIAKADPICATAKRHAPLAKLNTLIAQFPTPTQAITRLLRKTAVAITGLVDQLSALAPPAADRSAIARWIGQDAAIGKLVTKGADEVARGDLTAAFSTRLDIAAASNAPLAFAQAYGLPACSTLGT